MKLFTFVVFAAFSITANADILGFKWPWTNGESVKEAEGDLYDAQSNMLQTLSWITEIYNITMWATEAEFKPYSIYQNPQVDSSQCAAEQSVTCTEYCKFREDKTYGLEQHNRIKEKHIWDKLFNLPTGGVAYDEFTPGYPAMRWHLKEFPAVGSEKYTASTVDELNRKMDELNLRERRQDAYFELEFLNETCWKKQGEACWRLDRTKCWNGNEDISSNGNIFNVRTMEYNGSRKLTIFQQHSLKKAVLAFRVGKSERIPNDLKSKSFLQDDQYSIPEDYDVIITGHSEGAAEAVVAYIDMKQRRPDVKLIMTGGAGVLSSQKHVLQDENVISVVLGKKVGAHIMWDTFIQDSETCQREGDNMYWEWTTGLVWDEVKGEVKVEKNPNVKNVDFYEPKDIEKLHQFTEYRKAIRLMSAKRGTGGSETRL